MKCNLNCVFFFILNVFVIFFYWWFIAKNFTACLLTVIYYVHFETSIYASERRSSSSYCGLTKCDSMKRFVCAEIDTFIYTTTGKLFGQKFSCRWHSFFFAGVEATTSIRAASWLATHLRRNIDLDAAYDKLVKKSSSFVLVCRQSLNCINFDFSVCNNCFIWK